MKIITPSIILTLAGLLAWSNQNASAQVTFSASGTGANSEALNATVTFQTLAGNKLQVTLANTETGDAHTTANLLTAVFFNDATGLTPVSAIVQAGQLEWNSGVSTTLGSDLDVGTQWAYAYTGGSGNEQLNGSPNGNTAGISSSGFNWFGHGDFDAGGAALDGAPYGLVPLGFMSTGGSHDGLSNGQSDPTFENTAVFTLSGWTGSLSSIANVSFQYGTATSDTSLPGISPVPEPTTLALAGMAGLGMLLLRRRKIS